MRHIANILRLGVKELRSLWRDPMMLVLIVYAFSLGIYVAASAMPETLNKAPIAIVDEDQSPLSNRITGAFYPPHFTPPALIPLGRSEEHTSELQSLMRISYAVFCLKKTNTTNTQDTYAY